MEFYVKLHTAVLNFDSREEALVAVAEAFGYENGMCAKQLIAQARNAAQKKDGSVHDYKAIPLPPPRPEAPKAAPRSRPRLPSNFPRDGENGAVVASSPFAAPGHQVAFVAPLAPAPHAAHPPHALAPPFTAAIPLKAPSTEPVAATTISSTTERRRGSLSNASAPPTKRSRKVALQAPAQATLLLKKMREKSASFTLFDLFITQLPAEHYGESEEDATLLLGLCEDTRLEETLFEAHGREAVCEYLAGRVQEWVKMGAVAGTWYPYAYQCLTGVEEEMKREKGQQV